MAKQTYTVEYSNGGKVGHQTDKSILADLMAGATIVKIYPEKMEAK
jgi:hypothetical protein